MKVEIILGTGFSSLFGSRQTQFTTNSKSMTVKELVEQFLETNKCFKGKVKARKIFYGECLMAIYVVDGQVVQSDFIIGKDVTLKILPVVSGG